jgi:FXSXX-COOH protein
MHEATRRNDHEGEPLLPILDALPLKAVLTGNDSALSTALRRLVQDMNEPGENYAAHSSSS